MGEEALQLAREALETWVRSGQRLEITADGETLTAQQACFVTLRVDGALRGCVGSIEPVHATLAGDIVDNAIGAGTRDPRFLPVRAAELDRLAYSVDVLSPLETVVDLDAFDPGAYGMVVSQRSRVGVLLPGIPEVQSAQQQFEVCCQKGEIDAAQPVQLQRFTVERYAEPGAQH